MAGALSTTGQSIGFPDPNAPVKPPSIFDVYGGSLATTGQNYDSLMGNYNDLFASSKVSPITPISSTPTQANINFAPTTAAQVNPTTTQYAQSGDTTNALGALSGLASTGGYSDANIADLRARGVSPIRAVYGNAQTNLDRQKTLQGGYSPGYTAATAKMARELSDSIASQITNVNAGIAQNVASNKIAAAPAYASAAGAEAARATGVNEANTAAKNTAASENASAQNNASQFNAQGNLNAQEANTKITQQNAANKLAVDRANQGITAKNNQQLLDIIKSMQSLYGTTPALANTFGNQALTANAQNTGIALDNNRPPVANPLLSALPGIGRSMSVQ